MTIPENITVHLGLPNDSSAPNVTVPFIDYIKSVASSEIFPNWPESALRANIYAQISYALNRVYTEYYRSRGYDFDITSTTQFDQTFIYGRDIFSNVGEIVDEVFNDYIVRQGSVEPLFAAYCNGTTVTCNGLSQWGSVALAEEGLTPYEILQYYYGNNINIVFNAPTSRNLPSYPGRPLRRGDSSQDVLTIQRQLNRIGRNYPAIGRIDDPDGIFGQETEDAVRAFQRIFNLTEDGVVGKATWYKIKSIWSAVKRLAEVQSEGISPDDVRLIYPRQLAAGDTGDAVRNLQYFLSVIAFFDPQIPDVTVDGVFGAETEAAVRAIQRQAGLTDDGIVGRATWNAITDTYSRTLNSIRGEYGELADEIYPGRVLSAGSEGREVLVLQRFINQAADRYSYVPRVAEDGIFGPSTEAAVRAVQSQNSLPVSGIVGPLTWERIVRLGTQ